AASSRDISSCQILRPPVMALLPHCSCLPWSRSGISQFRRSATVLSRCRRSFAMCATAAASRWRIPRYAAPSLMPRTGLTAMAAWSCARPAPSRSFASWAKATTRPWSRKWSTASPRWWRRTRRERNYKTLDVCVATFDERLVLGWNFGEHNARFGIVGKPARAEAILQCAMQRSIQSAHCDASLLNGRSLSRFEKLREGFQRVLGNVVFDALGIGFGGLAGNAEGTEHIDHQPMAQPHPRRQCPASFGQKYAAIRTRGSETGPLEPRNRLDRGGMRDAEPARDVGRPGLTFALEQIGDQLDIIFMQRA